MTATPAYLNARQNYPLLRGVQTNLYKCFITRGAELGAPQASIGLIHQKGLYDDPRGGRLRAALAARLALHLHFINKKLLSAEIEDQKHYEFSIYRAALKESVSFANVSNLSHPRTLERSFAHDGQGPVHGTKDDEGHWILQGHASRLVLVDETTLALFAQLYDEPGTAAREARLPVVHSREILTVLRRFTAAPRRLADLGDDYYATEHFHETNRQTDGTIRRETRCPRDASEWVVSGPHFYVGTPFNKTPNEGCRNNQDYSPIDLTLIPEDYLPRTNYVPACTPGEYEKRTPHWRGKPVTEYWRHVHRKMLPPTGERTLISSILPPSPAHILTVVSSSFTQHALLVDLASLTSSIAFDFYIKSTGNADLTAGTVGILPFPDIPPNISIFTRARIMRLNCVTKPYAPLWHELFKTRWLDARAAATDPRAGSYADLTPEWTWNTPFRTPYARRQALVELDALAALSLGMTLDELLLIYRVQFPVLQQYERETHYDQRGKIVFTVNRGLAGVGLTRPQWTEIQHVQQGDPLPEWAHDQQGPYQPRFDKCDRSEDMTQAYEFFQLRLQTPDA